MPRTGHKAKTVVQLQKGRVRTEKRVSCAFAAWSLAASFYVRSAEFFLLGLQEEKMRNEAIERETRELGSGSEFGVGSLRRQSGC